MRNVRWVVLVALVAHPFLASSVIADPIVYGPTPNHTVAVCGESAYLPYLKVFNQELLHDAYQFVDGSAVNPSEVTSVTAVYLGRPLVDPDADPCVSRFPQLLKMLRQPIQNLALDLPMRLQSTARPTFSSLIGYNADEKRETSYVGYCFVQTNGLKACGRPAASGLFNLDHAFCEKPISPCP